MFAMHFSTLPSNRRVASVEGYFLACSSKVQCPCSKVPQLHCTRVTRPFRSQPDVVHLTHPVFIFSKLCPGPAYCICSFMLSGLCAEPERVTALLVTLIVSVTLSGHCSWLRFGGGRLPRLALLVPAAPRLAPASSPVKPRRCIPQTRAGAWADGL